MKITKITLNNITYSQNWKPNQVDFKQVKVKLKILPRLEWGSMVPKWQASGFKCCKQDKNL